jgi:hypothetical protein
MSSQFSPIAAGSWIQIFFNSATERLAWLAARYHNDSTPDAEGNYIEAQLWGNAEEDVRDEGEGVFRREFWAWTLRRPEGNNGIHTDASSEEVGSKNESSHGFEYEGSDDSDIEDQEREYPDWDGDTDVHDSEEAFRAFLNAAEAEDDRLDALVDAGAFDSPEGESTSAPTSGHTSRRTASRTTATARPSRSPTTTKASITT